MALGADTVGVIGMVFRKGLTLVVLGLGVGLAGSLFSMGLLQAQLFGVEPTDPTTFVGVGIFFLVVATLASIVPALRAARIDPAVAFRVE